MLAFLSLDEHVEIHERVGGTTARTIGLSAAWDSVIWPLVYIPLVFGIFVLLLIATHDGGARARRFVLMGLGLLLAAVAAEVVSAPWSSTDNAVHRIEGAVEEGLELAGWTLIAAALMTIAVRHAAAVSGQQSRAHSPVDRDAREPRPHRR